MHRAHADIPVVNEVYMPTAHAVHTALVEAAATEEYAPTAQAVQTAAPEVIELYAPAAQATQLVPTSWLSGEHEYCSAALVTALGYAAPKKAPGTPTPDGPHIVRLS